MPYFIRNSWILFLFTLFACEDVTIQNPSGSIVISSDSVSSSSTYTILQSGLPPPPLYQNAQDIVGQKYNVQFVWAAGCVIPEKLGDSIDKCNSSTFAALDKKYKTKMDEKIEMEISGEFVRLKQMDSLLKASTDLKEFKVVKERYPYFERTSDRYAAYFVQPEIKNKTTVNKLRLLVHLDTNGNKILAVKIKDSVLTNTEKYYQ